MPLGPIKTSFLKSRVARRIFGLFVLCALIPLLVLAGFTFLLTSDELETQAVRRLKQTCKAKGFEIYEHLLFLETEMRMIGARVDQGEPLESISFVPYASDKGSGNRFLNLTLVENKDFVNPGKGNLAAVPALESRERTHLDSGGTLVLTPGEEPRPPVLMVHRIHSDDPASLLLVAEINPVYLWGVGSEGSLQPEVDMIILDRGNRVLISSLPAFQPDDRPLGHMRPSPVSGNFEFELKGKPYIASYWELFIKPRFALPSWTIILCESRANVLGPVSHFKTFFLLMILLTFWVVALLSVILIRKSLVPITTLQEATERIAEGEEGTRVEIQSGDEFESLGRSFNEMSRKLEEGRRLLVQSAKMGAFGQMAAGVVHEIGQPLTSLLGLAELLLDGPVKGEERRHLELIQSELGRLREIVIRFRSFSKTPHEAQASLAVNRVLQETHRLLEHQFHMKGIHCIMDLGEDLPRIRGDRNGLQQVLVNLIMNAMDALEGREEGKGLIEIRSCESGGRVMVSISDNGPGIPEDIQKRIFDPFFTTKGSGEGTGLGLAISLSILHQHKGTIQMDSDPATGTRFTLSIPAEASDR